MFWQTCTRNLQRAPPGLASFPVRSQRCCKGAVVERGRGVKRSLSTAPEPTPPQVRSTKVRQKFKPAEYTLADHDVLHNDTHVIAVNKPAGVPTQPDDTKDPDMGKLVKAYLESNFQVPGKAFVCTVQRLDRPVSGIMVFAKTTKACTRMSQAIRERKHLKVYVAVVAGHVTGHATLENALQPAERNRKADRSRILTHLKGKPATPAEIIAQNHKKVVRAAQLAKLDYEAIFHTSHPVSGPQTLLKVRAHNGRKHQIRCQLAHMGNPIIGDTRYGSTIRLDNRSIALHSRSLLIEHPVKGEQGMLKLHATPPETWKHIFGEELYQQALGIKFW